MPSNRLIAVDLFAGAGGLSLGFEQAGFDVLAAVEIDPIHAATHEFNFTYSKTFCADIGRISAQRIRHESPIGDQDIDVVIGGAPCQGFSLMGKRSLDDPRNALIAQFARVVLELSPKYFVLENVSGLTVGKHRKFLTEVIDHFERNGYTVKRNYQVLNASMFGVPQDRRRLFLIGARSGMKLPDYPLPSTSPRSVRGDLPLRNLLPYSPSVWDAIGDLPDPEQYPELLERDWTIAKYREPSSYAAVLRGVVREPSDKSHTRLYDSDILTSSLRTVHTPISIARFEATKPGTVEPVSRFLRLHSEGISNTLRAGTASDRGAFTSPRPIHPRAPRCITVREAARLHGYPDWFRFHETKWHGFRQIGNSVPPPLARVVGEVLALQLTHGAIMAGPVGLGDPQLLSATQATAARHFGVDPHVIPPRRRATVD